MYIKRLVSVLILGFTLIALGYAVPAAAVNCDKNPSHPKCSGDGGGGKLKATVRADFRDDFSDGVRTDLSSRTDLRSLDCGDFFLPDPCPTRTRLDEVDFWHSEDHFGGTVDSAFEDLAISLFGITETEVRSDSRGSSTFPAYVFFSTAPFPDAGKTILMRWLVLDFSVFTPLGGAPLPNIDKELYDIGDGCPPPASSASVPAGTEGYLPPVECDASIDNVIGKMGANDAFSPPGDPFLDSTVGISILVPTDVKAKGKHAGQITLTVVYTLRYTNDLPRCDMYQEDNDTTLGLVTIIADGSNAEAQLLDENGVLLGTGNFPMEMTLERVFCDESGTCSSRLPVSATKVEGSDCLLLPR